MLYKRGIPSAAIGYLKEAVAGTARATPASASCATTWRWPTRRTATPPRRKRPSAALAGLQKQLQTARTRGATAGRAAVAADVRAMLDRLNAKV